jgi:hypothetical protein
LQQKYAANGTKPNQEGRRHLDIMELKKSFEFRKKPTNDLEGNEQLDDED